MRAAVLIGASLLASAAQAGGMGGASVHASAHSALRSGGRSGVTVSGLSGRGGVYNGFVAGGGYRGDRRFGDLREGRFGPGLGYDRRVRYGAGGFGGYGEDDAGQGYGYGGEGGYDPRAFAEGGYGGGYGFEPQAQRSGYIVSGEGAYAYGYNGYAETPTLPYGPGGDVGTASPGGGYGQAGYPAFPSMAYVAQPAYGWTSFTPCGC